MSTRIIRTANQFQGSARHWIVAPATVNGCHFQLKLWAAGVAPMRSHRKAAAATVSSANGMRKRASPRVRRVTAARQTSQERNHSSSPPNARSSAGPSG